MGSHSDLMLERVRDGGLVPPRSAVVAMLSGGRDSVCLLDLLVRLLGAERVVALHVNYGLRDDSDADERHCAELCERLGVALEIERPRRPEGPGNLQAWARDTRYAAAARLSERHDTERGTEGQRGTEQEKRGTEQEAAGPTLIATGHTADDQVETILYRLASSPSRRALLGMRPADGKLVRPLLAFSRAETTAYCEERGLAWRDDPTNEGDSFARNRVRNRLAPALAEIHPAAAANVLRTSELLRDEAEVLDGLVEAELDGSGGSPRGTITLERLGELHPALRRLVVQRLADRAAGRPVAGAANHAEEVAALRRTGTAMLDLGGGVRAVVERGVLRAQR
jgi:tRNA(Ile)-lysidine synthase